MALPIQPDQRHVVQAKHNEELLHEHCFPDPCAQDTSKYTDWTVIIAFYVALHYIQAYLSKNRFKTDFISHTERNDYLKQYVSVRDQRIDRVLLKYISLYKLSRKCRYSACYFHYLKPAFICNYFVFALQDLPKQLDLT